MPKFLSVKTFKKLTAFTLIASLLLNPIAHATSSYIEIDSQESDTADRLHTMMPLSHVRDISHIEIDPDEQRVRVYKKNEIVQRTEDDLEIETSSASVRETILNLPCENIYNLPWQLGQEGLVCFLSQHTAWLTPLSEGEYKLEFTGRLLGGMWWSDSSEDSGGYSNDYGSGSYSSNSEQSESAYYECDSNGRCVLCVTIYADSSQPTYNDQSSDYGRSYGKSSDGGSSSYTSSSSSSYTNSSNTNHQSRPATSKPAAPRPTADLSKLYAGLNIKPPAKPAAPVAKPATKTDLSKLFTVAKPVAKPAAPVAKPVPKTDLSKLFTVAKPVAKPAAKPAPKPDLSKLFTVAKPAAKPAAPVAKPAVLNLPAQLTAKPVAKPAAPAAKPAVPNILAQLNIKPAAKPAPKPVAKPAAKPNPFFTQLESIRQAAAQKAQQQKKITEVVQVLQAMNRDGLISQNLFTVPAFLSSYTPEKLEVLLHQLKIFIELAKDDASLNRVIQTWQAEDEKSGIFVSPGDAEFIQVKMGGRLGLVFDMIKNGSQKTKDILRNVTEIYKRETTKRFIQKDWKKDLDIPQGWNKMNVKKQDGVRYRAPEKKPGDHHEIRVMKGRPESDFPGQRVDCVKLNKDGKHYGINGNIVDKGSQEAHIPLKGNEKIIENLIKKIWK